MMHLQRRESPTTDPNYVEVSFDEFANVTLAFMLFNALTSVGVVYLASYTGLNRWRALQEYDRVVKSPDSPLALKSISGLMASKDAKNLKRNIKIIKIIVSGWVLFILGVSVYAGVTHGWERLFDQLMFYILIPYLAWGFSAFDHTLPTTIEGLLRFRFRDNWQPLFITMPRKKWQRTVPRVIYTSLAVYTALSINTWSSTTAVAGIIFLCVSKPLAPGMYVSVRGFALVLLGYVFAIVSFLGVLIIIQLKNGGSNPDNSRSSTMGKHMTLWNYSSVQYLTYFTGILSALVLRAEWSAAQKAAETRARGQFEVRLAEKEALLEKAPEDSEQSALDPVVTGPAATTTSATTTTQAPVKARAIRVPPVDLFHLNKDAAKAIGKLEPFASPVFNTLILTTLLAHIPAILFSASHSSLAAYVPSSSTLARLSGEYVIAGLAWKLPAQLWGLIVQPVVLVVVLMMRWNSGGKEIWRYGEKWSKELPKVEQPIAMVTSSSAVAPSPSAENHKEPLLTSESA